MCHIGMPFLRKYVHDNLQQQCLLYNLQQFTIHSSVTHLQ